MSSKFNPFHQWLGLDAKLTNPHHFQLLGVSPKIADASQLKKTAHKNAQAHLATLKSIDAGQRTELLVKVKQRVVKAHQVLTDDDRRNVYLAKLKEAARQAKAASVSQLVRATDEESPTTEQFKGSPSPAPTELPPPAAEKPLPKAIPMAVPIKQPVAPASDSQTSFNIGAAADTKPSGGGPDFSTLDDQPVMVRTSRVRRKRSWAVPIFSLLLVTVGMVGITAIVLDHDNLFTRLQEKIEGPATKVGGDADPGNAVADGGANGEKSETPTPPDVSPPAGDAPDSPDSPLGGAKVLMEPMAMDQQDLESVKEMTNKLDLPEAVMPTDAKKFMDGGTGKLVDEGMPPRDPDGDPPMGMMKSVEGSGDGNMTEPEPMSKTESKKLPEQALSESQLRNFVTAIYRGEQSLFRGDDIEALAALKRPIEFLKEHSLPENQVVVAHSVESMAEAAKELDDFWKQVIKSCQSIPAAQEIIVGDQILGFVDVMDNRVVLRVAGGNQKIPFRSLKPGLALALANQGAVENIPEWGIEQATLYAIHRDASPTSRATAMKLLDQSQADGYAIAEIKMYLERDLSKLPIDPKVALPPDQELKQLREQVRGDRYEKIKSLDPAAARDHAIELLNSETEDSKLWLATLEECYDLAIEAVDPLLMMDLVRELDRRTDFDAAEKVADGLSAISKTKMDESQARAFGDAFIELINSDYAANVDDRVAQKLAEKAVEIVDAAGHRDLLRIMQQKLAAE